MDISRLADLLKNKASSALEDYSQLADAYPNLKNFAGALVGNVERNVPTQAELQNPEAMQQRALGYMSPMAGAIKAYHGTPHEFERFDMSKIGTGEGAQSYGHGLYFAENPKVAEEYKNALSARVSDEKFKLQYHRDMAKQRGDFEKAKELDDKIKSNYGQNIYETSIQWPDAAREAADPLSEHHLLDWDKPLSEQSQFVQNALKDLPHRGKDWTYKDTLESMDAAPYLKEPYYNLNPSGNEIYKDLGQGMMVGNNAIGQTQSSQALNKIGIPGIKYLDQGSRAGGGTSNYVMFGDEYPQIVNRASTLAELLRGK